MKSLWQDNQAKLFLKDPLALRVYTSQLLGKSSDLVLHGGGNTSVKISKTNIFGQSENLLYVKGSGWDLATIEAKGFAPIRMDALLKMAKLTKLSDSEMVREQRAAMINPNAPNPSVEAILHAIIPYRYVDHTHADSVVTITNTPNGENFIKEIYGKRVLIVPYVMPGFILARRVYELTRGLNWKSYDCIVLLNHGIFTFDDDAKESYERMINLVTKAEKFLAKKKAIVLIKNVKPQEDLKMLATLRLQVSRIAGKAMLAKVNQSSGSVLFSQLKTVRLIATRGPLTPDHVIRTKPIPVVLGQNVSRDLDSFVGHYKKYFNRHASKGILILDSAPRWAVWQSFGTVSFGSSYKDIQIAEDVIEHTIKAIQQSEKLGGWKVLPEKDIFEMEYWELEQAKLKLAGKSLPLQGKVVLVTGAASGIGKACVESFAASGAAVIAVDIDSKIRGLFNQSQILEIQADLTKLEQIKGLVERGIRHFGGLDIVISNAGIFPASENLKSLNLQTWQKSLDVNLSSHAFLIKECIPYLSLGLDATVIMIGSKNVAAPGPGVSAYSVAKAGLTQLARVASLELASEGIRANVIHPNQVFDTAIWTKEVLEKRAKHYGISVAEYKTNNLLKVEITSKDVAALAVTLAGDVFLKTTGAQIPIDGGNDRVI